MKINQSAVWTIMFGVTLVSSTALAKVVRIEDYVSNPDISEGKRKIRDENTASCAALAALGHNVEAVSFSDCATGEVVTLQYQGKPVYCLVKGTLTSLPNGCDIDNIQINPTTGAKSCVATPNYQNIYYNSNNCPNPAGDVKYFCENNGKKVKYRTSCTCGKEISLLKSVYDEVKDKFNIMVTSSYIDSSISKEIVCAKSINCSKNSTLIGSGNEQESLIGEKIKASFAKFLPDGISQKSQIKTEYGYSHNTVEIKGWVPEDGGILDEFDINVLLYGKVAKLECSYIACVEHIDITSKKEDSWKKIFTNPDRVNHVFSENTHANIVEGKISISDNKLPWIRVDDKPIPIRYFYSTGCLDGYTGTTKVPNSESCDPGHNISSPNDKFSFYNKKEWVEDYYCYKCSGCQNGYSNDILYASSGITSYTISPTGGNSAFTKDGCKVICSSGYTKICTGSGSSCSNSVFYGSGKTKDDIYAASGITSGLGVEFVYNTYSISVPNAGNISCAIATGCNISGGYISSTCDDTSWSTWFLNN